MVRNWWRQEQIGVSTTRSLLFLTSVLTVLATRTIGLHAQARLVSAGVAAETGSGAADSSRCWRKRVSAAWRSLSVSPRML